MQYVKCKIGPNEMEGIRDSVQAIAKANFSTTLLTKLGPGFKQTQSVVWYTVIPHHFAGYQITAFASQDRAMKNHKSKYWLLFKVSRFSGIQKGHLFLSRPLHFWVLQREVRQN